MPNLCLGMFFSRALAQKPCLFLSANRALGTVLRLCTPVACAKPQFVDSLAELSEPIQTPSSVMTFAVICGLILMRLQNLQNYNIKCKDCEAHYIGVKQQGNWALGKTKTRNQCKPAISSLLCLNTLRTQATNTQVPKHSYLVAGNEPWSGLFMEQFCSLIKTRLWTASSEWGCE